MSARTGGALVAVFAIGIGVLVWLRPWEPSQPAGGSEGAPALKAGEDLTARRSEGAPSPGAPPAPKAATPPDPARDSRPPAVPHPAMDARSKIKGIVIEPSGAPIAGALVEGHGPYGFYKEETDAQGGFEIDRAKGGKVPGGVYRFTFSHREYEVPDGGAQRMVTIAPREEFEFKITMSRGARVQGVVTDAESGKPVPGARVWIGHATHGTERTTTADAAGRYVLTGFPTLRPGVPALKALLRSEAPTYEDYWHPMDPLPAGTASVELNVALRPGAIIEGTVLSPGMQPAPKTKVSVSYHASDGTRPGGRSGFTDEAGIYRFDGLGADTVIQVHAYGEGLEADPLVVTLKAGERYRRLPDIVLRESTEEGKGGGKKHPPGTSEAGKPDR